ncbi:MAG TPA: hypothetical protein VGE24_08845, partial [Emticicia sp.]
MNKIVILVCLILFSYEGKSQSIFLTKSQRIHLIDSLELRIKSLSKQPQSFTRDTALFRSFQLIFVQSGQLNPNLVKNHRTYSIIFDSLSKISNRINWLEGKADVLFWKAFGLRNVENNESKAFNYFSKAQLLYHQLSLSNKEAWSIIQ